MIKCKVKQWLLWFYCTIVLFMYGAAGLVYTLENGDKVALAISVFLMVAGIAMTIVAIRSHKVYTFTHEAIKLEFPYWSKHNIRYEWSALQSIEEKKIDKRAATEGEPGGRSLTFYFENGKKLLIHEYHYTNYAGMKVMVGKRLQEVRGIEISEVLS